ncbi:hypothetical protein BJF77_17235 [Kocuria sp. CNJ-770]|nr:hypothetical protein BJF77_17235 [Kocuria sp. CNJ-770]
MGEGGPAVLVCEVRHAHDPLLVDRVQAGALVVLLLEAVHDGRQLGGGGVGAEAAPILEHRDGGRGGSGDEVQGGVDHGGQGGVEVGLMLQGAGQLAELSGQIPGAGLSRAEALVGAGAGGQAARRYRPGGSGRPCGRGQAEPAAAARAVLPAAGRGVLASAG